MKFAVVGCGRIGAHPSSRIASDLPPGWLPVSHVESFLSLSGENELALCDSDAENVGKWASHYELKNTFTDYHKLLREFQPEILSIATRTPVKKEIVLAACEAGVRGIYLEKPIANSLKDCHDILDRVRESGCQLFYGVTRRYHSTYRRAKALLSEGLIGELEEINIEHGPSQLLWTHPHSMDLILYLSGSLELESVQSSFVPSSVTLLSQNGIDSDPIVASAHFTFRSGLTANLLRTRGLNVRLSGREGIMTIQGNGEFLEVYRRSNVESSYFNERKVEKNCAEHGATVTAFRELINAVKSSQASAISLGEIELGTRMLIGCAWSHLHGGRTCALSDVPNDLVVTGRWGSVYA